MGRLVASLWSNPTGSRHSIFLSQHDGDYLLGNGGIGRVRGVKGQVLVVVINFEKYLDTIEFNPPKIVLPMRVDCGKEIVERSDSLYQTPNGIVEEEWPSAVSRRRPSR